MGSGGTLGGYGSVTGDVTNSGVIAPGSAAPGLSGSPMGAFTINGNYTGAGGTMAINTVLGGSGSPSDLLVISGGAATGNTIVHVTNVGGVGAETTGNGIQVVEAVNGATTSPGAFALPAGEFRAGAFDYDLFRGGLGASNRQDWFLRSDFVRRRCGGARRWRGGVPLPIPPFPIDPPPNPLPPNVLFPIIGPELATYGVVQPLARQLGLSILGTLDDRGGDTYEPDGCAVAPAVARRGRDFCGRPADQEAGGGADQEARACALPVILALGLGPLLRPNDPQQLSSLRRSQRQRRSGRLPGRHRSSARISDRRPVRARRPLWRLWRRARRRERPGHQSGGDRLCPQPAPDR